MPKRKAAVPEKSAAAASAPAKKTKTGVVKPARGAAAAKEAKTLQHGIDHDGNAYWDISSARKVTISKFKGQTLIGIREWYDNGTKPGTKGIQLTVEQYQALVDNIKSINATLRESGIDVKDPATDAAAQPAGKRASKKAKDDDEDDDDDDDEQDEEQEHGDEDGGEDEKEEDKEDDDDED